jgi:site-specific DNA-cytosine methylase
MKTVELFSGTKSFSKVMAAHGHETLTIDNSYQFKPDVCQDIFAILSLPQVDIVWASPPCTTFSVASISHYWTDGKPKNEKALLGIAILEKAISLIAESKPTWWFIENPHAHQERNATRGLGEAQKQVYRAFIISNGNERVEVQQWHAA